MVKKASVYVKSHLKKQVDQTILQQLPTSRKSVSLKENTAFQRVGGNVSTQKLWNITCFMGRDLEQP